MFSSCPPPAIVSTAAASSPSSRPSTPTASSVPQPMDLDRTHPVKRDPHHGLCFNCGKPGHIAKVCQGPCAQNIQNIDAMTILRLAPKDLQFLTESLRVTVTLSMPTMPPPESEGKKTPGDKGLKLQLVKRAPQLPPVITSDCKYHCNPTSSPVPQTHERKATPVNTESPHMDNPVRPPATPPAKTYILLKTSPHSLNLQVELMSPTSLASITTSALLDSGATGMFINWDFVWRHWLETTPLPQPVLLHNVDGSANEHGSIMEEVHALLHFGQHLERAQFTVTNLG